MIKRYDLPAHVAEQNLMVQAAFGDFILYTDHAALIAKVREIAESMPHAPECESLIEVWVDTKVYIGFEFPYECTCPRGKLLEVINGRD